MRPPGSSVRLESRHVEAGQGRLSGLLRPTRGGQCQEGLCCPRTNEPNNPVLLTPSEVSLCLAARIRCTAVSLLSTGVVISAPQRFRVSDSSFSRIYRTTSTSRSHTVRGDSSRKPFSSSSRSSAKAIDCTLGSPGGGSRHRAGRFSPPSAPTTTDREQYL